MDERDRPEPEFVAHLEWQLRTALQRRSRFSEPTRSGNGGTMKLAMVVLVSAMVGAGGMAVTEEVQQSRAQEVRLAQLDTEIRMAELQVQVVRTQLRQVEEQVGAGVPGREAVLMARAAHEEARGWLEGLRLEREELLATGRDPDDRLSAPLVDGRDFPTERLELRLRAAETRSEPAEWQHAMMLDARERGIAPEIEVRQTEAALEQARLEVDALREQLSLRKRYLEGELTAEQVRAEGELAGARRELRLQELAAQIARGRLEYLREWSAQGVVHRMEVERARLEVLQLELAQELARLRIEQLRTGGGPG